MRFYDRFVRYALALVAAGAAFILRIAIVHFVGPDLPTYITFYPFIMFIAILAGLGPGLLATITSAIVVDYWVLPPLGMFKAESAVGIAGLILFSGMGVLMSAVAEHYRRSQEKLLEEVRLANSYNRSLIEASLDPLLTISAEGKITDVNKAVVESTGLSREKLIGSDFSGYFTEAEKARQGYRQVFDKGFISDYPLTICRKDGRMIDVLYNATVYKDDNGKTLGVFAAARDITLLKHIETELEKTRRLSDIGTLAAMVAHELRNPLAAIGLAAYNIKKKANNPGLDKHLANIKTKVAESDQIINNLLFYSRIKPPNHESINIADIIEECADALKEQNKKEVAVINNLDSIRGVPIEADPIQIKEVFQNILNNAHDAVSSDKGEIRIIAEDKDEFIKVVVEDNGNGINKEILDKIFDPFFTTKAKGTGLGLSVCKNIVNMHEGEIEIKSETGQGTSVLVRLPKKERII